jgi:hypothetical protein
MKTMIHRSKIKVTTGGIFIDLSALAFIYLVPTISHLLRLPVYLIEPMRLMLILALVHTGKTNAYFLALTMPVFSFFISGHPVVPKMALIAIELALNVALFYYLSNKIKHLFPAVLLSILLSKTIYYLLKFLFVQVAIVESGLISTPLLVQVATSVLFSIYAAVFYNRQETGN